MKFSKFIAILLFIFLVSITIGMVIVGFLFVSPDLEHYLVWLTGGLIITFVLFISAFVHSIEY